MYRIDAASEKLFAYTTLIEICSKPRERLSAAGVATSELYVQLQARLLARNDRQWTRREGLPSSQTNRYRLSNTSINFVPSLRTSRGVTPKRRLNERLK